MTAASPLSAAPLAADTYARHVVEAGDWLRMRVLSPGAVSWYLRELERQLGPDRGLGDTRLRKKLTTLLRSKLPPDSCARRRLIQLMPVITNGYLPRWATTVDSTQCPSPERLARAIATYLLDCGHSSGQLHRWARALSMQTDATLEDLLADASKLADQDNRDFDVLMPFVSIAGRQPHHPGRCPKALSAAQHCGSRRQHRRHRTQPSPTDSSSAHWCWS